MRPSAATSRSRRRGLRAAAAVTAPVLVLGITAPLSAVEPDTDLVAPTVSAVLTRDGVKITATDAGSGLDRIEIRRYLSADSEPDWTLYTGPFQPQAHDVPGVIEYRAVDLAGNISDVFTAPGEQYIPVTLSVGRAVHGKKTVVTLNAAVPTDALGLTPNGKPDTVKATAVVRLDGKRELRAKIVDGKAQVKLPAALTAGRHTLIGHVETDFPGFYTFGASTRFKLAKATSRTRVAMTKGNQARVHITTPEGAKAKARVTIKFVNKGKTRAVVRTRLLSTGLVGIHVALPDEIRNLPGTYRVKVTYAGTKNVKSSRATSKKFTVR